LLRDRRINNARRCVKQLAEVVCLPASEWFCTIIARTAAPEIREMTGRKVFSVAVLSLLVLAISPAQLTAEEPQRVRAQTTTAELKVDTRQAVPSRGATEKDKDLAASCCTPPGPNGLHCCDTRDCGWFSCDSIRSAKKSFR
jgi:hypothetical protein